MSDLVGNPEDRFSHNEAQVVLQQIYAELLLFQVKRVSHVLAKIRRIVGFFHRNATANRVLANKADLLGLPAHKLIIDVVTRWNSAYDMVERFAEMQPAVYSTLTSKEISSVKEKDLNTLNDDDVSLAEELISLLKPMKDITAMLCTETEPTLSIVKPLLNQLAGSLTEPLTSDSVTVKEIKAIMRKDIQSRYEKQSDILNLATALDPRFKTLPSLSDEDRFEVYRVLTSEAAKLTGSIVKVKTEPGTDPAEPTPNTNDPPLPALPSLAEENIGDDGESLTLSPASVETVTKVKDEVVETKTVLENILGDVYLVKVEPAKSPLEQAELQVSAYRKEQTLHVAKSPLQWWKQHQHMFPLVAKVAKRVLCIPATSVPSERVFSTAGDIVTQQRSRIKPKNVDMLIFLKKNLTPKPKPKKTKKSA